MNEEQRKLSIFEVVWTRINEDPESQDLNQELILLGKENIAFFLREARSHEKKFQEKIALLGQGENGLTRSFIDETRKRIVTIDADNLVAEVNRHHQSDPLKKLSLPSMVLLGDPSDTTCIYCHNCRYKKVGADRENRNCCWEDRFKPPKRYSPHGLCFVLELSDDELFQGWSAKEKELENLCQCLKHVRKIIFCLINLRKRAISKPYLIGIRPKDYLLPGDRVLILNWSKAFTYHAFRWEHPEESLWLPGTFLKKISDDHCKVIFDHPFIKYCYRSEVDLITRSQKDNWERKWEGDANLPFTLKPEEFNYLIKARKKDPEFFMIWMESALGHNPWRVYENFYCDHLTKNDHSLYPEMDFFIESFARKKVVNVPGPKLMDAKEAARIIGVSLSSLSVQTIVSAHQQAQEKGGAETDVLLRARDTLLIRFAASKK
jgi:hypothetical protein